MEAAKQLNIFFFPFYTASHMLPLVEVARLFAAHDNAIISHIVTTHHNAKLFERTVDADNNNASKIILHKLDFPAKLLGLPDGLENHNSAASLDMSMKLHTGFGLLQQPMEQLLRRSRPDCIVSDMFFPWTADVAEELQIPRIQFNPTGYFPHCVIHNLRTYTPHETVQSETESFQVPGLPDLIQMKKSQLTGEFRALRKTGFALIREKIEEAESRSFGTILNSFLELEPRYIEYYKKVTNRKFWNFAPLSLFCRKSIQNDGIHRDEHEELFEWLDSQEPNSVLYVCFGSMVRFSPEQLKEIAAALEGAGKAFIWVCRPPGNGSEWLPEGFEERMKKRDVGMLIKGWAPQVQILEHPSIAGFMNHCGWNSVVEAVTAGVPLMAWPLFSDHFYNERLIVDLLKIGIQVGALRWNESFNITAPTVAKDRIQTAISRFMSGSKEAEEMNRRAKELKNLANLAVHEGGSSYFELMDLISQLKSLNKPNRPSGIGSLV